METKYTMILPDGTEIEDIYTADFESGLYSYAPIDSSVFVDNVDGYWLVNDEARIYTIGASFVGMLHDGDKYYIELSFETETEKIRRITDEKLTLLANKTLTDEQAAENPSMFPEWKPSGAYYAPGDKVNYRTVLYKCLQGHESQPDWTPSASSSLWVAISDPTEEWPAWIQPTGAHDAYSVGDKVSHKDAHWVSDVDGNVWEPGVTGWTQQD